jgi:hypothetical protein
MIIVIEHPGTAVATCYSTPLSVKKNNCLWDAPLGFEVLGHTFSVFDFRFFVRLNFRVLIFVSSRKVRRKKNNMAINIAREVSTKVAT